MRIWQAGKKRQASVLHYEKGFNSLDFTGLGPVFKKGQPLQIGNEVVIVAKDAYGESGTVEVIR